MEPWSHVYILPARGGIRVCFHNDKWVLLPSRTKMVKIQVQAEVLRQEVVRVSQRG